MVITKAGLSWHHKGGQTNDKLASQCRFRACGSSNLSHPPYSPPVSFIFFSTMWLNIPGYRKYKMMLTIRSWRHRQSCSNLLVEKARCSHFHEIKKIHPSCQTTAGKLGYYLLRRSLNSVMWYLKWPLWKITQAPNTTETALHMAPSNMEEATACNILDR